MEGIARHYDKVVLTLIMCLVVLFMATFSPFAESTKAVAIVDDAIIAIVIAALAACGITFIVTGAYESLEEYTSALINDYCFENHITFNQLFDGVQSGSNKMGQLLLNNRFVLVIDNLVRYIKARFSLADNTTTTLQTSGNYVGTYVAVELPFTASHYSSYWNTTYETTGFVNRGTAKAYLLKTSAVGYILVSTSNDVVRKTYEQIKNGVVQSSTNTDYTLTQDRGVYNSNVFEPQHLYYAVVGYDVEMLNSNTWTPAAPIEYSGTGVITAINTATTITHQEGILVKSGDITAPLDNDDYIEGDGAILDVGATWGESYPDILEEEIPTDYSDSKEGSAVIEFVAEEEVTAQVEETSEITNLPAGAIPFTPLQLPQFHLVDIWHYVAQWISDTAVAAGALMAIVVQNPSPMVNLFYATVCLLIIFGVIKGLAK